MSQASGAKRHSIKESKMTRKQLAIAERKTRAEVILFHRGIVLDPLFKVQNNFINDKAQLKAGLCTRRAGKSFGIGKGLTQKALTYPESVQIYIAKTRDSAKRIMMPVMRDIDRKFKLQMKLNKSDLSYTFPNGSIIYLIGMDSDERQRNKILGQSFLTAVIDEAAFFETDLNALVYEHLLPCISDYGEDGQIILISTPSDITRGLFYDITTGVEKGWSLHNWSTFDNPYNADQFKRQIEMLKKNKPGVEDTPFFKRMYLAQWVIDLESLVYKFRRSRNLLHLVPDFSDEPEKWTHILGVDLGFNDDSAFVVMAFHSNNPALYVRYAYKKAEMIVEDVANEIKHLQAKFPVDIVVCDPASKQVVEEIIQRYDIDIISAQKSDKKEFIELLNSEMTTSAIKIYEDACTDLIDELTTLVWHPDKKAMRKWIEHPACPNHLCDALLYGWRYCYPYMFRPVELKPSVDDDMDKFWKDEENKILEAQYENDNNNNNDREYVA